MKALDINQLMTVYGGTDGDWVDDINAGIRNTARWFRGFVHGLLGGDNCHCYN